MSLKAQDVYGILNSKIEEGSGDPGTSDYNGLTNKPKINGVELSGEKSLEDLGIQPAGDYLTEETDPTVPSWAKQATKPSYTAEEVGALPNTTVIPEIDDTLSVSGDAADSKVVGDKFTEVNGDIENIEENISDIKDDLVNTSDAIISGSEGETILVNDSGEKGLSGLKVFGWSKQKTATGAQLVNINKSGISSDKFSVVVEDDGRMNISKTSETSTNQEYNIFGSSQDNENKIVLESQGIASTNINIGTPGTDSLIILYTSEGNKYININSSATLNSGIEIYGAILRVITTAIGSQDGVFLQIQYGNTATDYEPYTGGQASPSPDYPQEIVSAGDEGEIEVSVSGGNICPTSSGNTNFYTGCMVQEGTQYTLCALQSDLSYFNIRVMEGEELLEKIVVNKYTTPNWESEGCVVFTPSKSGEIHINSYTTCQWTEVAIYPEALTSRRFEPYVTPQTLILSTSNGLPGIPVNSGGNYTDESGQQWVCDEIDFARGVYVQRVGKINVRSVDLYGQAEDCGIINNPDNLLNTGSRVPILSNYFHYATGGIKNEGVGFAYLNVIRLYYALGSVEAFNEWLSQNDVVVYYPFATPIETPLSAEEIAAYQSIHTYKPTTTITNDANTYMEVSYVKDIEQVINNTVNETVESAIDDYDTEIKSFVDTNYVKKTDLDTEQEKLEKYIESYYAMRRNGKVYQTKLWKFATNPTSDGEKLLSNAGLIFSPSTDTTEGQDDYLNGQHPMFEWVNVNYIRDNDGTARPTAIEGMDNYATSGSVDVGVMQMSFYWKWDTSNAEYDLITVSDSPHPELGLEPWPECIKEDGTILPWCIGSKYISGIASDGLLRSQPGLKPERKQSHNNMITNYAKKGEGYFGAGAVRNLFQIVFNIIKGATKSSQTLYQGVTSWNFQYDASVESETSNTYFPVTNSQAENLIVGNYVSVGYGYDNSGELGKDRSTDSLHTYADDVKILSIETLDENNKAVYLDIETGFNTTPVQVTDSLTSPIIMSSMHAWSGMTDSVIGKHDGSPISNTNSKMPYRVQGREYAVGGYIIASDTVMDLQGDFTKNVYVAEKGTARSSLDSTIRSTYKMVGTIPAAAAGNNADWWIGDIAVDMDTGVWYPSVEGSSSSQGMADRCYAGGSTATSGTREYLQGVDLWSGLAAGSACLYCGYGLSRTSWSCLGCD